MDGPMAKFQVVNNHLADGGLGRWRAREKWSMYRMRAYVAV